MIFAIGSYFLIVYMLEVDLGGTKIYPHLI